MDSNTNMLKVFENQEFGAVRLTWDSDRILFSATDSARALGYSNPYSAIKRHCRAPLAKREVVSRNVNQYGTVSEQAVEMSFITEGDLYRLIVHSKLPSAERFERWVFDEVLPTIRKHGAYMTDSVLEQVMENPDTIYSLAAQLLEDKAKCEELSRQLKQGGSIMHGWTNDERMMITYCNDGTRPVIFKIERIDIPESEEERQWLEKQNFKNTAEDAYTG